MTEVLTDLLELKDIDLGTRANNVSGTTKHFDESIYEAVFSVTNKNDQLELIDNAIAVTLSTSNALNTKLSMS